MVMCYSLAEGVTVAAVEAGVPPLVEAREIIAEFHMMIRRRTWSDEDKARIVAEIVASGESVSAVARRYGPSPQQLFG